MWMRKILRRWKSFNTTIVSVELDDYDVDFGDSISFNTTIVSVEPSLKGSVSFVVSFQYNHCFGGTV